MVTHVSVTLFKVNESEVTEVNEVTRGHIQLNPDHTLPDQTEPDQTRLNSMCIKI